MQELRLYCNTPPQSSLLHPLLSLLFSVQVFKDYFGELEEESIRDNFVVVYELLDETMDFGYPQTCESKILREYVALHGACLTSCLEERGLWIVGSAAL
jgi:AP-1 complex subunit mu